MKKFATVAAVALLAAIALPSCKKDYTCSCSYSFMGQTVSQDYTLSNTTKSKAKDACNQHAIAAVPGQTVTWQCELK